MDAVVGSIVQTLLPKPVSPKRATRPKVTAADLPAAPVTASVVPRFAPSALVTLQALAGNAAVTSALRRRAPSQDACRSTPIAVQLEPVEPTAHPEPATDLAKPVDPLADEAAMEKVALEGANRLTAFLSPYHGLRSLASGALTLGEALTAGHVPEFSAEYDASIADIRSQALEALHQAKGFLEKLDPESKKRYGDAALHSVAVAISAISDGNDIVFIVDSRTPEGQAALHGIKHFEEQIAIRNRAFRDESGQPRRVSTGLSAHSAPTDPGQPTAATVEDRSVSILDIGALYDNRALEGEGILGPVQDPPGTLHMSMDSASAVDLRAVFIHEVGGHASASQLPAHKERIAAGQQLTAAQMESQKNYNEMLVDNIVDKVAFFSFIRDDLSRELLTRLARN